MVNSNSNLFLSRFQFANHSNNGKKLPQSSFMKIYATVRVTVTSQNNQ